MSTCTMSTISMSTIMRPLQGRVTGTATAMSRSPTLMSTFRTRIIGIGIARLPDKHHRAVRRHCCTSKQDIRHPIGSERQLLVAPIEDWGVAYWPSGASDERPRASAHVCRPVFQVEDFALVAGGGLCRAAGVLCHAKRNPQPVPGATRAGSRKGGNEHPAGSSRYHVHANPCRIAAGFSGAQIQVSVSPQLSPAR